MLAGAGDDVSDVRAGLAQFREGRFAEAFESWTEAADAGDARGALYLGVLYDSGQGVRQDYGQAIAWYSRAAMAGSAAGAFNVGVLYDAGLGVAKSPEQAALWYGRAAARHFGRAEYNLAMLYESGTGVPKDRQRAVALFRSAAVHGVSAARTHLAALGQPFQGVTVSPAPNTGVQDIQQAQQLILSRSPAQLTQAAVLFRRTADQHNALAEYDLGYCYEHGLGVPQNAGLALSWYRRATADATGDQLRTLARTSADYLGRVLRRDQPAASPG